MAENLTPTPVMTSEAEVLKVIKKMQLRRQIIPILIVVLLLVVNLLRPTPYLSYLAIAAFGWYVYAKMFFRTKNKIAVPEPGTFVSPVDGKIKSIRKSDDTTLITIRKSWLDVVELRLPYTDMKSDIANVWSFDTLQGKVEVRIKTDKFTAITPKNETGTVAGIIPGKAIIVIHLPAALEVLVEENGLLSGGETVLFNIAKREKNITVDEV